MRRWAFAALLACSCTTSAPGPREDERVERPARPPLAPFDECVVTTYREPAASAAHVPVCSELPLTSHPPTGGEHFGTWAAFGVYDAPIPWGFLIHSMEHGAVVLGYRCEGACPEVVAELVAIAEGIDDPRCRGEAFPRRVIVAPMPDLEVGLAALAWEHAYLATCLDPPSLRAFVDARYGRGPEDTCFAGADRAADGWCP